MKTIGHVQFIGHSGVCIRHGLHQVLIDPWLWSSDLRKPIVLGLLPPQRTIDFQLPEPRSKHEEYSPDAILVSHFHTHHSPLEEIRRWCGQKSLVLGTPIVSAQEEDLLQTVLKNELSNVQFKFSQDGDSFEVGPFKVRSHFHPQEGHLIWEVSTHDFSVLHMTDIPVNRKTSSNLIDICFEKFENSSPDFLFIGCTGSAFRFENSGLKQIAEQTTATPIQAAKIAALINPRFAGVIGHSNQSLWKNRVEYALPSSVIEDQFQWALGHLCPHIQHVNLRPSQSFIVVQSELGNKKIFMEVG